MSTILLFKDKENKYDVWRGKKFIKTFCESLKEHEMKIINFEKERNKVINKRTAGIIWKHKRLLNFCLKLGAYSLAQFLYCD